MGNVKANKVGDGMYIGIDLGTTGCKVIRFGESGNILHMFNQEYPLICEGDHVEQDALLWWELVCEGLTEAVRSCADPVRGISVSTQGISVVPVDEKGTPLCNAISWLDVRAEEETQALIAAVGKDAIYRKTGKFANACYTLPKLMWLKKHKPEIFGAAHKFLLPLDFLNLYLCGKAVCDYSIAGGIMAYDLAVKRYDPELLAVAGVDAHKLPEVACMGTYLGSILPEVAKKTGLPDDCPVYLGGQDQKLAALGAGIDENSVTISFGTASAVTKLTKTLPETTDFSRFRFNDDWYSYEGVVNTSGAALKWATAILGGKTYEEMNQLAIEAGSAGGVTFQTDLSNGGTIEGLTLATTPGNIVYALFEGVSRETAGFVEAMGGCQRLYVFGGGSKSDIWCQILANTAGREVCALSTPETGALGAAMLAANGKLPSATTGRRFTPNK